MKDLLVDAHSDESHVQDIDRTRAYAPLHHKANTSISWLTVAAQQYPFDGSFEAETSTVTKHRRSPRRGQRGGWRNRRDVMCPVCHQVTAGIRRRKPSSPWGSFRNWGVECWVVQMYKSFQIDPTKKRCWEFESKFVFLNLNRGSVLGLCPPESTAETRVLHSCLSQWPENGKKWNLTHQFPESPPVTNRWLPCWPTTYGNSNLCHTYHRKCCQALSHSSAKDLTFVGIWALFGARCQVLKGRILYLDETVDLPDNRLWGYMCSFFLTSLDWSMDHGWRHFTHCILIHLLLRVLLPDFELELGYASTICKQPRCTRPPSSSQGYWSSLQFCFNYLQLNIWLRIAVFALTNCWCPSESLFELHISDPGEKQLNLRQRGKYHWTLSS